MEAKIINYYKGDNSIRIYKQKGFKQLTNLIKLLQTSGVVGFIVDSKCIECYIGDTRRQLKNFTPTYEYNQIEVF